MRPIDRERSNLLQQADMSEVLRELESRRASAAVENLKRVSPLAWQHVNFYGRYQFDSDVPPLDLSAIARRLASGRLSGPEETLIR